MLAKRGKDLLIIKSAQHLCIPTDVRIPEVCTLIWKEYVGMKEQYPVVGLRPHPHLLTALPNQRHADSWVKTLAQAGNCRNNP